MLGPEVIEYLIRESARAIRIMARDQTILQAFDIGVDPTGNEFSMVLLIIPKPSLDALAKGLGTYMIPSKPVEVQ